MPYFTITDFAAGLDLRRSELTAPAGTLRSLVNAHITPGGEIEKRAAFVPFWECDHASRGLVSVNSKLYTFGPGGPYTTEPPGYAETPATPWTVGVFGLQTASLYEIVDYDLFEGKVFTIAWTDAAGTIMRFYDGTNIPAAKGDYCKTYRTKMYAIAGAVLSFSAVGDAGNWTGTGSGSIDLSLEDSDMVDTFGLEVYYDQIAVFSKTACQLWKMDPDPLKNTYQQTLRQAGTIAWRSVLQYGSGDVMYLSHSGIRSLRARNSSLAAAVSDIGSPLDPILQDMIRTMGEDWMSGTIAILQPVTGRFWIIMPDRIYILSAFPGPKITAWSEYDPGFVITAAAVHENRIVVRDDQHMVYAFAGIDPEGPVFDDCFVEIVFPFHAGTDVATYKTFTALDATCAGIPFDVYGAFNVENSDAEDWFGEFDQATFLQGKFDIKGHSTHMSLRLRSQSAGPQTLSNMVVHYQVGESG